MKKAIRGINNENNINLIDYMFHIKGLLVGLPCSLIVTITVTLL